LSAAVKGKLQENSAQNSECISSVSELQNWNRHL